MEKSENRRILIVDDEAEIRTGYRLFLSPPVTEKFASSRVPHAALIGDPSRFSFEIVEAESGEHALQIFLDDLARGKRFAGAVVDVRMPGRIDGLQFIQKAWQVDPGLLVVIATAYQDRSVDDIDRMFGPRFQDQWDYLNKPFTAGEIIQKARHLVSSWNRREREGYFLREIERQQKALVAQEQIAAVGKFSHVLGHELGNILQCALTKLETLPNESHGPEYEEIIESVELGAKICQDLLTFARREKENQPAQLMPLHLPLEKALRLLRHGIKNKDIKLALNFDSTLELVCHESRLVQVFVNLISNSLHAMSDGGTLTVSGVKKGESIVVEITDSGIGIKPEHQERLFEPLFSTKGHKGNGLGLTVCKSIIEDYHGTIEVKSQLGQGTTVRIQF
jgi:signal transduction histidine kinase